MARKIPELLDEWLFSREMEPDEMTDDELYSAALELQYDIEHDYDPEEVRPQQKASVTRYINHMGKTCERLPLAEWY